MNLPNGLSGQVDAYLHDELGHVEIDRLGEWLMESPEHARLFAREVLHFTELRSACLARGDAECLDEASATGRSGQANLWAHLGEFMTPVTDYAASGVGALLFVVALLIGGAVVLLLGNRPGGNEAAKHQQIAQPVVEHEGSASATGPKKTVARLSRLWKPQWSDSAEKFAEWAPLVAGQVIDLTSGRAEVFFDAGAQLTLQGPVRFEVIGPKSGRVFHGELTARVGEHAKGFSLVSAMGKVIDLGTEFGMSVQPDGELDVVVFDGVVDLQQIQPGSGNDGAMAEATSRITTGEAVRIKPDGTAARIVAIDSSRFTWAAVPNGSRAAASPVIKSVNDTFRTPGVGPFYEIVHGGLGEDVRAYVDRPHEWNGADSTGIPEFLRGADYVKTFNDDKIRGRIELTVELQQAADVYVFWDDRAGPAPPWLKDGFVDTCLKIGLDEGAYRDTRTGYVYRTTERTPGKPVALQGATGAGMSVDVVYSIWHREVPHPGPLKLGAVLGKKYTHGAMYGIAAVAKKPNVEN